MILVIDIGNTRTKFALYRNGVLSEHESIPTDSDFSPPFIKLAKKTVIGSVVPQAIERWKSVFPEAYIASYQSPWSFRLQIENPETVGVDRLANLEGIEHQGSVLVVDAGTATKFDLLEGVQDRVFPGGAIAPGVIVSFEAMCEETAQLKKVDLNKFSPVVGYNTETAIRSGVVHGFAAMVDGMILKIFEERRLPAVSAIFATGGNAKYLQGRAKLITHFSPNLTLNGLYKLGKKVFVEEA